MNELTDSSLAPTPTGFSSSMSRAPETVFLNQISAVKRQKSKNLLFFFNNLAPAISGPYLTVSATILNQFYKHSCPPRPMQSCFTSLTHIHIVDQIKLN